MPPATTAETSDFAYRYDCPRRPLLGWLAALICSLVLHGVLFLDRFFPRDVPPPVPPAPAEFIQMEMPPLEPEEVEAVEALGEAAEEPGMAPPQLAAVPSVRVDAFAQSIQPPPPPGMAIGKGMSTIPVGRMGSGLGKGMANLFDVHNLDQQPAARSAMPPDYPYEMRRQGITGTVDVDYIIDSEGNVVAAQVIGSSNPAFEMAAVNAVRKWKYRPGKKAGRSVNTRVQQQIKFNLEQ